MFRRSALFVLGSVGLLLTPLAASAQFIRPGAVPFGTPFVPPVRFVPPNPALGNPLLYGYPQFSYRQNTQFTFGGFNYRSSFATVGPSPVFPFNSYFPYGQSGLNYGGGYASGGYGRTDIVLAAQNELAKAQREAVQTASVSPRAARPNPAPAVGQAADAEPVPPAAMQQVLAPADAAQVASGDALNAVLKKIVGAESKGAKGPSAYIPPILLKDLRFAGSPSADLLNFARQGTLELPAAFDTPALATPRSDFEREFAAIAETLRTGKSPDAARVARLEVAFRRLDEASVAVLKGLSAVDSTDARRFLTRLEAAIKALKNGAANGLIDPNWAVEGLTGAELVKHMTKHKLEFGPAPSGAADAYETMDRNLRTYLFVLTQPKK